MLYMLIDYTISTKHILRLILIDQEDFNAEVPAHACQLPTAMLY